MPDPQEKSVGGATLCSGRRTTSLNGEGRNGRVIFVSLEGSLQESEE